MLVLSIILVFLLGLGSKTRIFGEAPPTLKSELKTGIVTDQHHVDPDPAFLVETDQDPAIHFDAEADPIPCGFGSSSN